MGWTQAIDAYCERLDPSFWAEPLNAVSNLAFFAAALFGIFRHGARGRFDGTGLALSILVAVIGTGSFLFHTFANRWSVLADVVPIAIFIYAYFGVALHRFIRLRWWIAVLGTLAFLPVSFFIQHAFAGIVGSSSGYLPALFALFGIGGLLAARRRPPATQLFAAGAVFTLSLAARIADTPLCPQWPLGTHFAWHILNAATLAILLSALGKGAHRAQGFSGDVPSDRGLLWR